MYVESAWKTTTNNNNLDSHQFSFGNFLDLKFAQYHFMQGRG